MPLVDFSRFRVTEHYDVWASSLEELQQISPRWPLKHLMVDGKSAEFLIGPSTITVKSEEVGNEKV